MAFAAPLLLGNLEMAQAQESSGASCVTHQYASAREIAGRCWLWRNRVFLYVWKANILLRNNSPDDSPTANKAILCSPDGCNWKAVLFFHLKTNLFPFSAFNYNSIARWSPDSCSGTHTSIQLDQSEGHVFESHRLRNLAEKQALFLSGRNDKNKKKKNCILQIALIAI